jgi:hypothetical protein
VRVEIPGYLDQFGGVTERPALVDASALLGHLETRLAVLSASLWRQGLPEQDVDFADADAELSRPEAWPCFALPLATGATLMVVYRNLEDEGGVDLLVDPGDGSPAYTVARIDGHPALPGLSWAELVSIASQSAAPAPTMLLLFQFVGDDLPPSASGVVEAALVACGVPNGRQAITRHLIDLMQGPGWDEWDGVPRYLGHGSTRGGAASPEFRAKVASTLPSPTPG